MKTSRVMVEQLETRIAPAVLANGGNLLSAGDEGTLSEFDVDGDATVLVKVSGGKAMVFWDSEAREITGISVSDGANLEVFGNVNGDIVTNLTSEGFLSDSNNNPMDGLDGGRLLASSIAGIKTEAYVDKFGVAQNGNVGRIIAGGSVSNVNLNGRLAGVYAGDGIFDAVASSATPGLSEGNASTQFVVDVGFDFDSSGPWNAHSTMTLKMSDADYLGNASINGAIFSSGKNVQFFAGDGIDGVKGTAANGGSISGVNFVGAYMDVGATGFFVGASFTVSAGHGGDVTDGNGGAGGSINGVSESGSGGYATLLGGSGGHALAKGNGGTGGSVSNLDLQGGVTDFGIASGTGGNGTTGGNGGLVSNVNIASKGIIALAGPFMGTIGSGSKDFFVINPSSGDMALIDGVTLTSSAKISALAVGPMDAITTDLNADGYLDVVILYSDKSLGILSNNHDGTFAYSVRDLGFEPFRVLAGDFLGDGENPELAIASTSKLRSTLKLYSATDPTDANSFQSDPVKYQPFILKKGNLADVAGGTSGLGLPFSMDLDPFDDDPLTSDSFRSDLVLGFADGTLQGLFTRGEGTAEKPFFFTTVDEITKLAAPKMVVPDGISSLDFNFPSVVGDNMQALAVVSAKNSGVRVVSIAAPPPPEVVEGEPAPVIPDTYVFTAGPALAFPPGFGSALQAVWTSDSVDKPEDNTLIVLASDSTKTSVMLFAGSGSDGNEISMEHKTSYEFDLLISGTANNGQFLVPTSSYIFTTGDPLLVGVYQDTLPIPEDKLPLELTGVGLPFKSRSIELFSGSGGNGTTGNGGAGGDIRSINFDSNYALISAGNGGTSTLANGGNGGSFSNAANFRIATGTIKPSLGTSDSLGVSAGDGASALGTGGKSKAGHGGSISGLTVTRVGDLVLTAGDGGDSTSLAAGNGGSVDSLTIFNAGPVEVTAGDGGDGTLGAKASGGWGGSVSGFSAGDTADTKTRFLRGNISLRAGSGGDSDFFSAGKGGSILNSRVQNMESPATSLIFEAGNGGSSLGGLSTANAGHGGSVSGLTFTSEQDNPIAPTITTGQGGNAVGGSGGNGGALSNMTFVGGLINLTTGSGGNSTGALSKGNAGAGGAISGIKAEITGSGHMSLVSGGGGVGGGADGGAGGGTGGAISNVFLQLNPNTKASGDETLGITFRSGNGGVGSKGGSGGAISGIQTKGVYDSYLRDGLETVIDSIAMRVIGGDGGEGLNGDGGAGASVKLSRTQLGLSQIDSDSVNPDFLPTDEALRIFGGNGGDGTAKGGLGGSVTGAKSTNVRNSLDEPITFNLLSGAYVKGGNGGTGGTGDAGAGGSVIAVKLSVEHNGTEPTGNVRVEGGHGGSSTAGKGGAGGIISNSSLTSVNGNADAGYGILAVAGDGGTGAKSGGSGGNLSGVTVSFTATGINGSSPTIYGAVLLAGDGGDGTGTAKSSGGTGGSIVGISQPKDVYSVTNLIQAGSGGDSSADTKGAAGGSVSNVQSAGYLGAVFARANIADPATPQGQFNTIATSAVIDALIDPLSTLPHLQQGVFSGLGGTGLIRGINGSVTGVNAPYIAAIGAADLKGNFGNASTVSKIAALLVAYDIDGSGTYDPGDGFVMADKFSASKTSDLKSIAPGIVTDPLLASRTAAFVNP